MPNNLHNILVYTPFYLPKIGGLENMASYLANEWHHAGHHVTLVCYTTSENEDQEPFPILRNPSTFQLLTAVKRCDIFFQLNVSLKGIWPLLLFKRKYVVSHQTSNFKLDGSISLRGKLKQYLTRYCYNIACSTFIADLIPSSRKKVIGNAYRSDLFQDYQKTRDKALVFVGRLVSDKGCMLLLRSLNLLKQQGLTPTLTIIGNGPESDHLKQYCSDHHLDQIYFLGALTGKPLVEELNLHQVMVIPSIWEEPFGIVTLEGLASGCKVVASHAGGIPEALGGFGTLFKKNDAEDLAEKLKIVLYGKNSIAKGLENHLLAHTEKAVAQQYVEVFDAL